MKWSAVLFLFMALSMIPGSLTPFWSQYGSAPIAWAQEERPVNGFMDVRGGRRTQADPNASENFSIAEARLQLEFNRSFDWGEMELKSDFLHDWVLQEDDVDLREANALFSPLEFLDVKIGRQVISWGTGDLIFINDLFPKDWISFFIGRDYEYLKVPANALKLTFFSDKFNLDVVYFPRFESDRFIMGERLSFWNNSLGQKGGGRNRLSNDKPDDWLRDDEIAVRFFKNIRGWEWAAYGYHGFWKSPAGLDPLTRRATFPELNVFGASVRGNILNGVGNLEMGYVDSLDDPKGDDPFVRNSEIRLLAGFEREVARDFKAGLQYYLQFMIQHDEYRRSLPPSVHAFDEYTHLVTLRLTNLLMNQDLTLSLFIYYLPADQDGYLRPKVHYRITDQWSADLGANVFLGAHDYAFFGQYENNTNVYLGLRYSF